MNVDKRDPRRPPEGRSVTFDEAGVYLEDSSTRARYRVQAATATNAVDFMKHQKGLIFALLGNSPAELEAYRVQQHPEGGSK